MKTVIVNIMDGASFVELDYDDDFELCTEQVQYETLATIEEHFVQGSLGWEFEGKVMHEAVENGDFCYEVKAA